MLCLLFTLNAAAHDAGDLAALKRAYELPDPTTAAVLSGFLGFGSGHFYAKKPARGMPHLLLQTLGGGLIVASQLQLARLSLTDPDQVLTQANRAQGLVIAGSVVLSGSRIVDIWTAPTSARETALAWIDAHPVESSGSSATAGVSREAHTLLVQFYASQSRVADAQSRTWGSELALVQAQFDAGQSSEDVRAALALMSQERPGLPVMVYLTELGAGPQISSPSPVQQEVEPQPSSTTISREALALLVRIYSSQSLVADSTSSTWDVEVALVQKQLDAERTSEDIQASISDLAWNSPGLPILVYLTELDNDLR